MKDRVSRSPGRYRAVVSASDFANMEAGNQFAITLIRDDDPSEVGTPYSKDTVLPDDLVEFVDLSPEEDPTPADVLWSIATQGKENNENLTNHICDKENPHGVTCEQIGAATKEEAQSPVFVTLVSFDEEIGGYVSSKSAKEIKEAYENNKTIYALHDTLVYSFTGFTGFERDGVQFVSVDPSIYDEPHPVKAFHISEFINDSGEPYNGVTFEEADIELATTYYVDEKIWENIEVHLSVDNPHKVTCEKIGAATKEEVEATKSVVVTVNGATSSHTTQEIYDAVATGKVVYLKMWSSTYTICTSCTPDEAKFESSYSTGVVGADGKNYACQYFRMFVIANGNKVSTVNNITASVDYINAQIAYALSNQ